MALGQMLTANLSGKTAMVTGASSGLGSHFARVLASSGAQVIVGARRVAPLDDLVGQIRQGGGRGSAIRLDVTDAASIEAAFDASPPIDILINNAGVTVARPVLEQTPADYDHVLGTNLRGAFLVATAASRRMRDHGGGAIVNIASILGLRQGGGVSTYAMSKAGVIQLTRQLALELARYHVRVNAIAPGYFETDLNRAFFASAAGKALIARIPQRRLGRLEDLDGALLLLASDASRFMTGGVIAVDGGHLVSSL